MDVFDYTAIRMHSASAAGRGAAVSIVQPTGRRRARGSSASRP